jgi:hypothetical protein
MANMHICEICGRGKKFFQTTCEICWSRIEHPAYHAKINAIMSRDLEEALNGK